MTPLESLQQDAFDEGVSLRYDQKLKCNCVTMTANGYRALFINPERVRSIARETVLIAHEMGHIKTGSLYDSNATINEVLKKEYRSWKWAVERLVPKDKLDGILSESEDNFWAAAEELEVTIELIHRACWLYYGVEVVS